MLFFFILAMRSVVLLEKSTLSSSTSLTKAWMKLFGEMFQELQEYST